MIAKSTLQTKPLKQAQVHFMTFFSTNNYNDYILFTQVFQTNNSITESTLFIEDLIPLQSSQFILLSSVMNIGDFFR